MLACTDSSNTCGSAAASSADAVGKPGKGQGKSKGGRDGAGKGYGKFGKSKWDNHPTQAPYRVGLKGGKTSERPKRSGGRHASWYRQFYAMKAMVSPEELRQWLAENPHPGKTAEV